MTSPHDKPGGRRPADPQDEDLWGAAWSRSSRGSSPAPSPTPAPVSQRRVYRAGNDDMPAPRRSGRRPTNREDGPVTGRPRRSVRRSPVLAVAVLVIVALVIILVGVGARGGGLGGSQNTGTFKLIPISTTTTT